MRMLINAKHHINKIANNKFNLLKTGSELNAEQILMNSRMRKFLCGYYTVIDCFNSDSFFGSNTLAAWIMRRESIANASHKYNYKLAYIKAKYAYTKLSTEENLVFRMFYHHNFIAGKYWRLTNLCDHYLKLNINVDLYETSLFEIVREFMWVSMKPITNPDLFTK